MIIVCIPAYNEGRAISELVQKARQFTHQVIVVDDGSTDDTARSAESAGASVIRHWANQGPGQATKSCLEEARRRGAQVVVTLDGDGQHDPDGIPQVLSPILGGKADLVIGSRFLANHDSMPRYRWLGIKVISWLYNFGSKVRITDTQSCFRAYGEKALNSLDITERGFGFSVELLVQARKRGLAMSEVPITCIYHSASHSANPVTHGLGVALTVVKHRFKTWLRRSTA
jgi:glycosyltransferase involved in cell wall biosynthesis